jgi:hypothetical protein
LRKWTVTFQKENMYCWGFNISVIQTIYKISQYIFLIDPPHPPNCDFVTPAVRGLRIKKKNGKENNEQKN